MASNTEVTDADAEYESDPEDLPLPTMRRREAASDDEEGSDGETDKRKKLPVRTAGSEDESNSQGGVEAYDDDDVDGYDEDEEEAQGEEEYDELGEELEEEASRKVTVPRETDNIDGNEEHTKEGEPKEGEKKENEPFAVPTSGAFYMHDDRFQENGRGGGGRRRRIQGGGRRIWNAKEEGAWVHDRFEELNINESRHGDERRRGRGRRGGFQGGRGRGREPSGRGGGGRGSRSYYNNENQNQIPALRSVRGRGQRRYEPVNRNNSRNPPLSQDKQTMPRNQESGVVSSSTKQQQNSYQGQSINPKSQQQSSSQGQSLNPKNNVISSSLNSASPPFYPSSNQDNNTQTEYRPKSTLNPNTPTTTTTTTTTNNNNINNSRGINVNSNKSQQYVKVSSPPLQIVQQKPVQGGENNKEKQQAGFMYGGSVKVPHGDQGFAGTPALLPLMQFSGQQPGVPALGMAVPGYVANSQLGFNNSAWVIAGGPGSYPYVASYYNENNNNNAAKPETRASSSNPSRETGASKSPDPINSSLNPEVLNEETGQRQNKPRRYSEMTFGQQK